jgi:hypothetical protein
MNVNIGFEQNNNTVWITMKKENMVVHLAIHNNKINYSMFRNKQMITAGEGMNIDTIIKSLKELGFK